MADLTDWGEDLIDEDETIIELTDIADEGLADTMEEEIIELTDIVEDDSHDLNLDIVKEENVEAEEEIPDFTQDLELEIDTSVNDTPMDDSLYEPEQESVSSGDLMLTQEQIETALERVVEKKFADKIESILFEVMEKVIEKEINEIKESLQKDLDQLGNV